MKVVVTGALGHIGSRLVRTLPGHFPGAEIVMIDNLSTQRYPSLFDLSDAALYRFVEADVTEVDLVPNIAGADCVIQLAAMTDAAGSFDRRQEVESNNFTATKRVAEACLESGVPLIVPSSTSVYGTQSEEVGEDCAADDLKPQSPYAETKLREEGLISRMTEQGLKSVVLRLGTIFGPSPGMRFHTAINKFCWQAVMGMPLTVWRTAYDQRRPYLDLDDAVSAIAFFLEGRRYDGRVYNVVTTNATVREVIAIIRSVVGPIELEMVDERIMNQLSYAVRPRRLERAGFVAAGDLARGIEETVKLLRNSNMREAVALGATAWIGAQ